MKYGIPKEVRDMETRVGLTPGGVQSLVQAGHTVYVERDAGTAAGYHDEDYRRVGGEIVYSAAEAYGRADIVCKIARPTAAEYPLFREGQTLFAFFSMASASADLRETLAEKQILAIPYERIEEADGTRPVLLAASEIAGHLAPIIAGNLLMSDGGRGVLLGGLPGIPPAAVVILGAGVLGTTAAQAFLGAGAEVVVLDNNVTKLRRLEKDLNGRVTTMYATSININRAVLFADVLVGAAAVPGQRAPLLVHEAQVKAMRRGAIILDYAIDEGGCIATSRPTTRRNPTFTAHGVIHYCVPNITAAVGRTASKAITYAALPYLQHMAQKGLRGE